MNERKLTKSELAKREDIIMKMKDNKRALVQKYGKDAEAVMYGRATNLAKKKSEGMDQDKIKELVKDALQNPKKADLNKDGKLSDYEKKRGAAIEKSMVKEWGSSDQSIMNQSIHRDLGEPKEFPGLSQIIYAAEDAVDFYWDDWDEYQTDRDGLIMSAAQRYARQYHPEFMAMASKMMEPIDEIDLDLKGGTEKDKDADIAGVVGAESALGLEEDTITEAFLLDSDIEDIVNALGYSDVYHFFEDNPGAADAIMDWVESIPEFSKMLRDADLREDLDLGHQDDEPHMLKADLYRIGKYAMELYQMVDDFEGQGEVDFPHWWQSKIIKSKDALVGAKHYLDFEIKEPQIDAMVDVAAEEEVIDENALGMTDSRLSSDQHVELDYAVRGDNSYTFGNDPYADDQLRYKYAKKMGFLEEKKEIKEGVWSLGSANEIKDAIHTLEMWYELDARQISALFDDKDNSNFFYNIVGDDIFHDYLNRVEKAAAVDDTDSAHNNVGDAIGRAEELLAFVQKREGLSEGDMVDEDIDKVELPSTTATKANTAITTAPTMAKVLLKMYNQLQSKEQTDFSKNADLRIVLQKLEKLASQVKESKGSIAEKLAKQLKSK